MNLHFKLNNNKHLQRTSAHEGAHDAVMGFQGRGPWLNQGPSCLCFPLVLSISFLSPPFLLIQRNHVSQILSCFSFLGQMFLMNGPSTIPHCASFLRIAALLPTFPRRSEVIQPKPVLLSPRPSPDLKLPGPVHVAAPSTAADTRDSWLVSPHKQVFGGPC